MNIIFFGSSQFALPSLKALLDAGYRVSCVVTQPDREKGRGLALASTAVKEMALKNKVTLYQPEDVNAPESIKFLKGIRPDLFVVVAYGQILSEEVLKIPAIFCINLHASLLPEYRGAAPVNWAIIKGEKISGVTVIKMAKEMDAGPIIAQRSVEIREEDDAVTLEERLAGLGASLLSESVDSLKDNTYKLIPQDENRVKFAPKLKKENGLIYWQRPAPEIRNLIRGCLNWPGACTYYKGKLLKIYKARVSSQVRKFAGSNPGEILEASKEGIVVFTGEGNIIIEELQIEGKRRVRVEEFISGHKILPGEILRTKK